MSSSKPPGPSRAEIALQQQQTMALGSQTALLEQQAARQEEQYRQQQQLAPLLYEQMGLRPEYNEQGAITGFTRFETPEQALYREQIETMRAQQPQQAALQQQYLTLAQQQAEYQQRLQPGQEALQQQYLTLAQQQAEAQARQQPGQERLQGLYLTMAEEQAAAQQRQQPGQERLQALYLNIAESQARSQELEAAWQQETAPQRRAQIEAELRLQQQTVQYQEGVLKQFQEQQKMQPLLYEEAGLKPIYDEAGNITSFGRTEEGQKRQDYESALLERQRKALAGELPVDPTLERTLSEGEAQLRANLQAQLGTGYETSTPGIQALAEFSRRAAEARSNVAHGQLVSGQELLANEQTLNERRRAGATSGRGLLGEYGLRPVSFGQDVQAPGQQGFQVPGQPNYLSLASNAAPGMSQYNMPGLFAGGSPTASAAGYQAAVASPYGTLGQFGDLAKQYGSLVQGGGNLVNQISGQRTNAYNAYQQGAAQQGALWGQIGSAVGTVAGGLVGTLAGPGGTAVGAAAGGTLGSFAGQQGGRWLY